MNRPGGWAGAGLAVVLALVAAGCGSDDNTEKVTAQDYRFSGLPSTVDAGTKLELTNASKVEVHELVAFRLPDGENRSIDQLVKLPEAELGALLAGEPAAVLIAPPDGADQITAVGDGKLTVKGRYAIFCFIPTGAVPAAYLQAASAGGDGPPQVPGGPPHFTQGMYGQITVK
jgi:plastocyanin